MTTPVRKGGAAIARALATSSTPQPAALPALRLEQVLEKLSTPQGEALGDALYARIAANLEGEDLLEPAAPLKNPPTGAFNMAIAAAMQAQFTFPSQLRQHLSSVAFELLCPYADKKTGVIDAARAAKVMGPEFAEWFRSLAACSLDVPKRAYADRSAYEYIRDSDIKTIMQTAPTIAPRMGSLDFAVKTFAKPDELKGFQFFGLQHLFASTAELFSVFETLGIPPTSQRVLGKVYSTNYRVAAELTAKGVTVDPASKHIGDAGYTAKMRVGIRNQIKQIIANLPKPTGSFRDSSGVSHPTWDPPPHPKALLVDDGAEVIKTLCLEFPDYAPWFSCVEQTRRGARIAHRLAAEGKLKCAVVNVAESRAKLFGESPMIGASVVREVERKLDRIEASGVKKPETVVVMGYGAIGRQVAAALAARGVTVHVYDQDPAMLENLPPGMVGHTKKAEALAHAQVLVSCVGERTLFPRDYDALPDGAVLVNAASADDELGPSDLLRWQKDNRVTDDRGETWEVFQGKPISTGLGVDIAHTDSVVRVASGKEFLVASNGFVVNMTGERDPIPPRYIQLTRALLLMGALAAARSTEPGIIELPEDWQTLILDHVTAELAPTDESLANPLWASVIEAPPGKPPLRILEELKLEQQRDAELAKRYAEISQALRDGTGITETLRGPRVADPGTTATLRGMPLGVATDPKSHAYRVATQMGLRNHENTPESWALYDVANTLEETQGWGFQLRLDADEKGRPTIEDILAAPANAARAQVSPGAKNETIYSAYFGIYSRLLIGHTLQDHLQRDPTDAEVAVAMRRAADEADVDLGAYVDYARTLDRAAYAGLIGELTKVDAASPTV